jgi:hypothetical protein
MMSVIAMQRIAGGEMRLVGGGISREPTGDGPQPAGLEEVQHHRARHQPSHTPIRLSSDVPILAAELRCRADVLVFGDRPAFGARFGSGVSGVGILRLRAVLHRVLGLV